MADDFAEGVLLFEAFMARLGGGFVAAEEWCGKVGLDFKALGALARRREEVVETMAAAGLSPVRGEGERLAALGAPAFAEGLRRFKRCLHAGLQSRLLALDEASSVYTSRAGQKVRAPPPCTEAQAKALPPGVGPPPRPRWLVTDAFRLAPVPKRPEEAAAPLLYRVEAGLVSVLDGFVQPDPEAGGPRFFAAPE